MARMGMDVDAVEQVGRDLQLQSGQLADLVGRIDRVVAGLPSIWDGPDASRFVNEWWPQHKAALVQLKDSVHGLGQSALNNASEQREVSGGGASPAGGSLTGQGGGPTGGASGETHADGGASSSAAPPDHPGTATRGLAGYQEALARSGSAVSGGWAPYEYQCTSWARYRREELGLSLPTGNGYQMADSVGLVDPSAASTGSLVSTGSATASGHVMVVEERLSGEPLSFRVSEMNVGDNDWQHGHPEEYRDNSVIRQRADGSWEASRNGGGFRSMAAPRFTAGV